MPRRHSNAGSPKLGRGGGASAGHRRGTSLDRFLERWPTPTSIRNGTALPWDELRTRREQAAQEARRAAELKAERARQAVAQQRAYDDRAAGWIW